MVLLCKSIELRIFKSYCRVGDLEILKNEDFHCPNHWGFTFAKCGFSKSFGKTFNKDFFFIILFFCGNQWGRNTLPKTIGWVVPSLNPIHVCQLLNEMACGYFKRAVATPAVIHPYPHTDDWQASKWSYWMNCCLGNNGLDALNKNLNFIMFWVVFCIFFLSFFFSFLCGSNWYKFLKTLAFVILCTSG